jgi:hypothetical protein
MSTAAHDGTISAAETEALSASWVRWLPHFIDQETPTSADRDEALEKAFVLATIRASHDVYGRVPGEAEMQRGRSALSRKLNRFYGLAREAFLRTQLEIRNSKFESG